MENWYCMTLMTDMEIGDRNGAWCGFIPLNKVAKIQAKTVVNR